MGSAGGGDDGDRVMSYFTELIEKRRKLIEKSD
jgi:hypothetical protein